MCGGADVFGRILFARLLKLFFCLSASQVTVASALENVESGAHAATSPSAAALYTLMTDRPAAIFTFRRFF